ncbi:MAG: hypothetical protein IT184_06835 [Acidobacteria bacterium]|nr:hypothetical protein [Acidobacteriota bacterium]
MAKRPSNRARTVQRSRTGSDATILAGLRQYVLAIEREGISIYSGDDRKHTKMLSLFKDLGTFVQDIRHKYRQPPTSSARGQDCRHPFVDCGDHCDMPDLCS